MFLRHAELVVQGWDQARKAVGLPKGFSGMFSFACHFRPVGGSGIDVARRGETEPAGLALEAWSGDLGDIKRWLGSGLIDAAVVPEPVTGDGLASRETAQDRLVLVSTVERPVMAWDPAYIYVDLGSEFRRQHSLAWPVDETAHMTFGSSRWALDYLLRQGGSAYLPWRLIEDLVDDTRLFPVAGAPDFTRALHLSWRKASLANHPWIDSATQSSG